MNHLRGSSTEWYGDDLENRRCTRPHFKILNWHPMDVQVAHHLLGTYPGMADAPRRAAYQRQKLALEGHLAQAQIPILKERFLRALALLDEAYADIEIALAAEDLPVLRALNSSASPPFTLAPGPTPLSHPASDSHPTIGVLGSRSSASASPPTQPPPVEGPDH